MVNIPYNVPGVIDLQDQAFRDAVLAVVGTAPPPPPSGGGSGYLSPNIMHVDPVSGNDANDGQSWASSKRTIQAAYDAIPIDGPDSNGYPSGLRQGGRIWLSEGRHDVGAGVNFQRRKPVELLSVIGNPTRTAFPDGPGGTLAMPGAVIYSTQNPQPAQLIGIGLGPDSTNGAYGHVFKDLIFEGNGTLDTIIRTEVMNNGLIQNCSARHLDSSTSPNCFFVRVLNTGIPSNSDASWNRLYDNLCAGMGLYEGKITEPGGRNNNGHVFRDNRCFGDTNRTEAFVYMEGASGCLISGNNFENGAIAMQFEGSGGATVTGNLLIGNTGERIDTWLKGGTSFTGNIMIDSGARSPNVVTNPLLYDISSACHHNIIIEAVSTQFANLYGSPPIGVNADPETVRIDPTSWLAAGGVVA